MAGVSSGSGGGGQSSTPAGSAGVRPLTVFASMHDVDRRARVYGDMYNRPQQRKAAILDALGLRGGKAGSSSARGGSGDGSSKPRVQATLRAVETPASLDVAAVAHDAGYLAFLAGAWDKWAAIPRDLMDDTFIHPSHADGQGGDSDSEGDAGDSEGGEEKTGGDWVPHSSLHVDTRPSSDEDENDVFSGSDMGVDEDDNSTQPAPTPKPAAAPKPTTARAAAAAATEASAGAGAAASAARADAGDEKEGGETSGSDDEAGSEAGDASDGSGAGAGATARRSIPPLVPANSCNRDPWQRPGAGVLSQVVYYATDRFTPIDAEVVPTLRLDMAVVAAAVQELRATPPAQAAPTAYALVTHPGHHASAASFGGYCFLNNAAVAARLLQAPVAASGASSTPGAGAGAGAGSGGGVGGGAGGVRQFKKVAVVDVDYHGGNGTASIFYEDPSVLVVSIHIDPDLDYPFTFGFADQTGAGPGVGSTLNLPLPAETRWGPYSAALDQAVRAVQSFGAEALLVSLGFDTYEYDHVQAPAAGFNLRLGDYRGMGAKLASLGLPTIVLQEGGYEMDVVGDLALQFMAGITGSRVVS